MQTFYVHIIDPSDSGPQCVVLNGADIDAKTTSLQQEGSKDVVNQTWCTTKCGISDLKNKGHKWKQGMWSKDEVLLLESNISNYCQENIIEDPREVIFSVGKKKRKDFYREIAKGINRPLFAIYRRVIRMYDSQNHVGKYSADELDTLKKLFQIHGNNWQAIAHKLGRSASSVKDRCRLLKDDCNHGKWSAEEEQRLTQVVYELTGSTPGDKVSKGISWIQVGQRVASRSPKQCRNKWLNYLNWKTSGGSDWTSHDDRLLVAKLIAINVESENDVNWEDLSHDWAAARSSQWLRTKWWTLRRMLNSISNEQMTFKEICMSSYIHLMTSLDDESNIHSSIMGKSVKPNACSSYVQSISGLTCVKTNQDMDVSIPTPPNSEDETTTVLLESRMEFLIDESNSHDGGKSSRENDNYLCQKSPALVSPEPVFQGSDDQEVGVEVVSLISSPHNGYITTSNSVPEGLLTSQVLPINCSPAQTVVIGCPSILTPVQPIMTQPNTLLVHSLPTEPLSENKVTFHFDSHPSLIMEPMEKVEVCEEELIQASIFHPQKVDVSIQTEEDYFYDPELESLEENDADYSVVDGSSTVKYTLSVVDENLDEEIFRPV